MPWIMAPVRLLLWVMISEGATTSQSIDRTLRDVYVVSGIGAITSRKQIFSFPPPLGGFRRSGRSQVEHYGLMIICVSRGGFDVSLHSTRCLGDCGILVSVGLCRGEGRGAGIFCV